MVWRFHNLSRRLNSSADSECPTCTVMIGSAFVGPHRALSPHRSGKAHRPRRRRDGRVAGNRPQWWQRWVEEGPAGLEDRGSRPKRSPRRTPAPIERKIEHLRRRHKLGPARISAVDDHSRLAYSEVLDDEGVTTSIGSWTRAGTWFELHGVTVREVLTDNGSAYRSHAFADLMRDQATKLLFTRPRRPQTNGKVERFNRTLRARAVPRSLLWSTAFRDDTALGHEGVHRRPEGERASMDAPACG